MITEKQLALYLGKDEGALELARRAVAEVEKTARCRCVEATGRLVAEEDGLRVENTVLKLYGNDIARLLEGCDAVYYFCATIGSETDRLIESLKLTDLTLAYAVDLCAGLWVDAYCDELEKNQRARLEEKGKSLTRRFSCGYGDMPLASQPSFIDALKADKFLGIRMTEGGMMIPSKTVSAVAGISDGPVNGGRRCDVCVKRGSCDGGICSD